MLLRWIDHCILCQSVDNRETVSRQYCHFATVSSALESVLFGILDLLMPQRYHINESSVSTPHSPKSVRLYIFSSGLSTRKPYFTLIPISALPNYVRRGLVHISSQFWYLSKHIYLGIRALLSKGWLDVIDGEHITAPWISLSRNSLSVNVGEAVATSAMSLSVAFFLTNCWPGISLLPRFG